MKYLTILFFALSAFASEETAYRSHNYEGYVADDTGKTPCFLRLNEYLVYVDTGSSRGALIARLESHAQMQELFSSTEEVDEKKELNQVIYWQYFKNYRNGKPSVTKDAGYIELRGNNSGSERVISMNTLNRSWYHHVDFGGNWNEKIALDSRAKSSLEVAFPRTENGEFPKVITRMDVRFMEKVNHFNKYGRKYSSDKRHLNVTCSNLKLVADE